jgi:hypothetical protein
MTESLLEKLQNYPWRQKAKQLVHDTYIEIVIGAVTLSSIFGAVSYNHNKKKEADLPVAFSEIEATTRSFEEKGQAVPPLTRFYSVVNDVTMKVFESNNIALAKDDGNEAFAHELETRVNPALKVYPLISEYAAEMPDDAFNARRSLDKVANESRDLLDVDDELAKTWDESHIDSYRTETYWVSVTNSDGKGSHTEMRTRQVYDHTTHYYEYNPEHGAAAAQLLLAFLAKYPDVKIEEHLYPATATHPENENAILSSMKKLFEKKPPTAAELLQLANKWATGSNLTKYLPKITADHQQLSSLGPSWDAATRTASSESYITYSRYDSGPTEYQIAENALSYGEDFRKSSAKIIDGIHCAGTDIPLLDAKIKEYVDVTLHGKEGDADDLRTEILDMSRKIYKANFENGFDVDPFSWLEVIGIALLGGLLGAAAGKGADIYFDKRKERETGQEMHPRW